MAFNPHIHHRKSTRLKGYDYSGAGAYFITLCCKDNRCLFGKITDGEMLLNEYGIIARDEWLKTSEIRMNVELDVFIIMPNHLHAIFLLKDELSTACRGELHSPNNPYSPNNIHSRRGELHSPNSNNIVNEIEEKGECNSCRKGDNFGKKGECNSPLRGHCKTSGIMDENIEKGECNSPLRGPSNTVGALVRGYKSAVTKQLNLMNIGYPVWQRNYHEHIIRNANSYSHISNYITNNPSNWDEDKFFME